MESVSPSHTQKKDLDSFFDSISNVFNNKVSNETLKHMFFGNDYKPKHVTFSSIENARKALEQLNKSSEKVVLLGEKHIQRFFKNALVLDVNDEVALLLEKEGDSFDHNFITTWKQICGDKTRQENLIYWNIQYNKNRDYWKRVSGLTLSVSALTAEDKIRGCSLPSTPTAEISKNLLAYCKSRQIPSGFQTDLKFVDQILRNIKSKCVHCFQPAPTKKCGQCKCTYYCNSSCQLAHWKKHKHICIILFEIFKLLLEDYNKHLYATKK